MLSFEEYCRQFNEKTAIVRDTRCLREKDRYNMKFFFINLLSTAAP